jgi:hypothetical protein
VPPIAGTVAIAIAPGRHLMAGPGCWGAAQEVGRDRPDTLGRMHDVWATGIQAFTGRANV